MARAFQPRRYLLRPGVVAERLDAHHLRQKDLAADMGLSRAYLSTLVQGHLPLSPRVRRALLAHPAFAGVAEAELWEVQPPLRGQVPLPCTPDDSCRGAA